MIFEYYRKIPRLPLGTEVETIRLALHEHKNKKWGFLIYRCGYQLDEKWARFYSILNWNVLESLELNKGTDLLPSFEMTVKEDRQHLDGASVDQVWEIFTAWVQGDEAKEELRDSPYDGPFVYPRYTYCVSVDADALNSVVDRAPQPPKYDKRLIGFVHLIQLFAEDVIEDHGPDRTDLGDEEDDLSEGHPNFVRTPLCTIGLERYTQLFSLNYFSCITRNRSKGDLVSLQ